MSMSQTIELPDDHRIARSELLQQAEPFRPLASGLRDLLAEEVLTARLLERVELQFKMLISGRNPRIPDLHHHDAPAVGLLRKRYRKTIHLCEILLQWLEPMPFAPGNVCAKLR